MATQPKKYKTTQDMFKEYKEARKTAQPGSKNYVPTTAQLNDAWLAQNGLPSRAETQFYDDLKRLDFDSDWAIVDRTLNDFNSFYDSGKSQNYQTTLDMEKRKTPIYDGQGAILRLRQKYNAMTATYGADPNQSKIQQHLDDVDKMFKDMLGEYGKVQKFYSNFADEKEYKDFSYYEQLKGMTADQVAQVIQKERKDLTPTEVSAIIEPKGYRKGIKPFLRPGNTEMPVPQAAPGNEQRWQSEIDELFNRPSVMRPVEDIERDYQKHLASKNPPPTATPPAPSGYAYQSARPSLGDVDRVAREREERMNPKVSPAAGLVADENLSEYGQYAQKYYRTQFSAGAEEEAAAKGGELFDLQKQQDALVSQIQKIRQSPSQTASFNDPDAYREKIAGQLKIRELETQIGDLSTQIAAKQKEVDRAQSNAEILKIHEKYRPYFKPADQTPAVDLPTLQKQRTSLVSQMKSSSDNMSQIRALEEQIADIDRQIAAKKPGANAPALEDLTIDPVIEQQYAAELYAAKYKGEWEQMSGPRKAVVWLGDRLHAAIRSAGEGIFGIEDAVNDLIGAKHSAESDANKRVLGWIQRNMAVQNKSTGSIVGTAGDVLVATVRMLPSVAMALMSGGTSMSTQAVSALTAANSTLGANIARATTKMVTSPGFMTSWIDEFGNSYTNDVNNGVEPVTAALKSVWKATASAMIEMGGGIETAGDRGRKWWDSVVSSLEEGGEEVFQGASGSTVDLAYSGKGFDDITTNDLISFADEASIISAERAGKEFGMGVAASSAMAGGQMGIMRAAEAYDMGRAIITNENAQVLRDIALTLPEGSKARNMAQRFDPTKPGALRTGNLYRTLLDEVGTKHEQAIIDHVAASVEARLIELGETENTMTVAKAIATLYGERKPSLKEKQALASSKFGRQVLQEMKMPEVGGVVVQGAYIANAELGSKLNTLSGLTMTPKNPKPQVRENQPDTMVSKPIEVKPDSFTMDLDDETKSGIQARAEETGKDPDAYTRGYRTAMALAEKGVDTDLAGKVKSAQELGEDIKLAIEQGRKRFNDSLPEAIKKSSELRKTLPKSGEGTLIYEDGVQVDSFTTKQRNDIEMFGEWAKQVGIRVRVYQSQANADGRYVMADGSDAPNGFYQDADGTIFIDINAGRINAKLIEDTIIPATAGHEVTHYLKAMNPEMFAQYSGFVLERLINAGQDIDALIESKMARSKHGDINVDVAIDEIIADASSMMLKDSKAAQQLAEQNPGLASKIKEWVQGFVKRVRDAFAGLSAPYREAKALMGDNQRGGLSYADELTNLWDQMVIASTARTEATAEDAPAAAQVAQEAASIPEAVQTIAQPVATSEKAVSEAPQSANADSVKYSLREFDDGTKYVVIDTDQHIFEGKKKWEYPAIAKQYMLNKFAGKVVGDSPRAFVNRTGIEEYANPRSRSRDGSLKDNKMRAGTELDNLLSAGRFVENIKDDGRHPEAVGGWDYHDVLFVIDDQFFSGRINIKKLARGDLFYDVTKIKAESMSPAQWSQYEKSQVPARGNALNESIPQDGTDSQRLFSERADIPQRVAEQSNEDHFNDTKSFVYYSIRPPYNDNSEAYRNFVAGMDKDAKTVHDLFKGVTDAAIIEVKDSRGKRVKKNLAADFLLSQEWNEKVATQPAYKEVAQKLSDSIPASIRKHMGMNDDGTLVPTPLEEKFKVQRSIAQRLVDALPLEKIDAEYTMGEKTIILPKGAARQSVGGEAYRRALVNESRKAFAEGRLRQVSVASLSKDNWGALGFIGENQKTDASGDFTTLCPQMMFNAGCFYCYRKHALETGLNNKLAGETIWYTGELLRLTQADIDELNLDGGLRLQSHGDWMPRFSAMLADVLYDAELRGLQVKVISKESSMADYIAVLKEQGIGKNLYYNQSADYVIEKAGTPVDNGSTEYGLAPMNPDRPFYKDEKGVMWWKRALTVEEANVLRKKYDWLNIRIVATRMEEFIRGLMDPRVDVVTGYHGGIRQFERMDTVTGEILVEMESLGDNGMPRFEQNPDGSWRTEYAGKTKDQKRLAAEIERLGLQEQYIYKSCCITGRCASCRGKCGKLSRTFEYKNATNRDIESIAYWQTHMQSAVYNPSIIDPDALEDSGIAVPRLDNKSFKDFVGTNKPQIGLGVRLSERDAAYDRAVEENDTKSLTKLVKEAAAEAGYTVPAYHGTNAKFNVFRKGDIGFHFGTKDQARSRIGYGKQAMVIPAYLKLSNPLVIASDYGSWEADYAGRLMVQDGHITREEYAKVMSAYGDARQNIALQQLLKDKGYDGIVYQNFHEGSSTKPSFIVFDPSQIKRADPITRDADGNVISLSQRFDAAIPDIRYQERDSDNTPLSSEQIEYFKDSKVRDGQGRLLKVYHGTKAHFSTFRTEYGAFFTASKKVADGFAGGIGSGAYYLDFKTPLVLDAKGNRWEALTAPAEMGRSNAKYKMTQDEEAQYTEFRKLHEALQKLVDDGLSANDYAKWHEANPRHSELYPAATKIIQKQAAYEEANSSVIAADDLVEWAKEQGKYDGVIIKNVREGWASEIVSDDYIALRSEQAKLTTNLTPTSSPDIRYQERETDYRNKREILANAFDTVAQTKGEKESLKAYKRMVGALNRMEAEAADLRKQGDPHTRARIAEIENRIEQADKRLLKMQNAKPLNDLFKRESQRVYEQMKAQKQSSIQAWRERRGIRDQRGKHIERIEVTAQRLMKWIAHPDKNNYVPESLRRTVATLLQALDMSWTKSDWTLMESNRSKSWQEALKDLSIAMQNADAFAVKDGELSNPDFAMVVDPDLASNIEEFVKTNDGVIRYRDLSPTSIAKLSEILASVSHAVTNANKMLSDMRTKDLNELAGGSVDQLSALRAKRLRGTAAERVATFLNLDMADSFSFFDGLGENAKQILHALYNQGFGRLVRNTQTAQDFFAGMNEKYKDDGIANWSGRKAALQTFEVQGGSISLTVGQMMELYMLNKRAQARGHIYGKGIRIEKVSARQVGKEAVTWQQSAVIVTPGDVERISAALTDAQRSAAEDIGAFLTETSTAWGNEVSMQLYGYYKFIEPNYYPIHSDTNFTLTQDPNKADMINAILNLGMTKATVQNANNPIIISDIFSTVTQHITDMANYNAFAVPLTDAMKWYNYKRTVVDENGNKRVESVKSAIERARGKDAKDYFVNLLKAINGIKNPQVAKGFGGAINMMIGHMKVAAVAGNIRVILQQHTSYVRASTMMNPADMALAYGRSPKRGMQMAQKYSPIAAWKHMGYYDMNIGRQMGDLISGDVTAFRKVQEATMKPAGFADDFTLGVLWNAAEIEVGKTYEGDKRTEDFYKKVGERLTEVIDRTQVVDTVFHRPQIMRDKEGLAKIATNFMSEPIKTYNLLANAAKSGNVKTIARVGTAVLATWIATALAAGIPDMLRDKEKDKGVEGAWNSYLKNSLGIGGNFFESNLWDNANPVNMIPYLKDVYGIAFGFSPSRPDLQAAQRIVWAGQNWIKLFNGEYDKGIYKLIYDTAAAISTTTGMPISNVMRDVKSVYDTLDPRIVVGEGGASAKTIYKRFATAMLEGDEDKALAYYTALIEGGIEPSAIRTGVMGEYKSNEYVMAAAVAKRTGNLAEYERQVALAVGQGLQRDIVVKAVQGIVNATKEEDDAATGIIPSTYAEMTDQMQYDNKVYTYTGTDLDLAVEQNNPDDIKRIVDQQVLEGRKESSVRSDIRSAIKALYRDGKIDRKEAEQRLSAYAPYENPEQLFRTMVEWDYVRKHGTDDGYTIDGRFLEAVRTGVDLKAVVAEYMDPAKYGYDKSSLAQKITSHFRPIYVDLYKKNKGEASKLMGYLLNAYVAIGYKRADRLKSIRAWPTYK